MEIYAVIGLLIAVYAVIANDSIQTLGTFLSSNPIHWLKKWVWFAGVLIVTLGIGWYFNNGDVSYGRLTKIPLPDHFELKHALAPISLLVLTRLGVPVSTTLFTLSVFASKSTIAAMVNKSVIGYVIALFCAFAVWQLVRRVKFPFNFSERVWVCLQWISTTFLWAAWWMQDAANVFVFLPRQVTLPWFALVVGLLTLGLGVVMYQGGGKIQKVVQTKHNVQSVQAACLIDLVYAGLLYYFKVLNHIPMSTTWVFVGLLAGRELAYSTMWAEKPVPMKTLAFDFGKLTFGLAVSVGIALLL